MAELQRLRDVLALSPVLEATVYDMKRRELTLKTASGGGPALAVVMGRAHPDHELVVMAADDARDLLCELSRPEYEGPMGGIRLPVPGSVRWVFRPGLEGEAIEGDGPGYAVVVYYQRVPRVDRWGHLHRGGVWWGTESCTDERGRQWTRHFDNLVTDDFGDLVSSETGVTP